MLHVYFKKSSINLSLLYYIFYYSKKFKNLETILPLLFVFSCILTYKTFICKREANKIHFYRQFFCLIQLFHASNAWTPFRNQNKYLSGVFGAFTLILILYFLCESNISFFVYRILFFYFINYFLFSENRKTIKKTIILYCK